MSEYCLLLAKYNRNSEILFRAKALSKNKFVNLAVQKVLTLVIEEKDPSFLSSKLEQGLDITIVGDNDFYSQRAYVSVTKELQAFEMPTLFPIAQNSRSSCYNRFSR